MTAGLEGIGLPPPSANAGRAHRALATAAISGNFPIRTSSFADTTNEVNKTTARLYTGHQTESPSNTFLFLALLSHVRERSAASNHTFASGGDTMNQTQNGSVAVATNTITLFFCFVAGVWITK